MRHRIVHRTVFTYSQRVQQGQNLLHLRPRELPWQALRESQLLISPAPDALHEFEDYFGNRVHHFAVSGHHAELSIAADSVVDLIQRPTPPLEHTPAWNTVAALLRSDRSTEAASATEFRLDSPYVRTSDVLRELAAEHFRRGRPLGEAALDFAIAIPRDFLYDPTATTIDTCTADVLMKRRGVCQDFAHLFIGAVRSLGLACRYVSGYLRTDRQPADTQLTGIDASHAWVSVYCPRFGWLDFDPTNGCVVSDRHITIGWGRDYGDVSPIRGVVVGGGTSWLKVEVDVVPLEAPEPLCSQ